MPLFEIEEMGAFYPENSYELVAPNLKVVRAVIYAMYNPDNGAKLRLGHSRSTTWIRVSVGQRSGIKKLGEVSLSRDKRLMWTSAENATFYFMKDGSLGRRL